MLSRSLPRKARRVWFPTTLVRRFLARGAEARSRGRLSVLDDHLLADIGLSRDEALAEAARTAWDAPDHWHR